MMTVTLPKPELEKGGTPCPSCKTSLPATTHFALRCPKCGQMIQAEKKA